MWTPKWAGITGRMTPFGADPLRDLWNQDLHAVYKELVRSLTTADGRIEVLQTLGKEGWKLAGIVTDHAIVRFYFKRPKD